MHKTPDIGELGEQLVAEWLQAHDWVILHHRWRCRWGEIDLIAQQNPSQQEAEDKEQELYLSLNTKPLVNVPRKDEINCVPPVGNKDFCQKSTLLAFVEVKTRSRGNWDADGLLAITPPKQAKLWRTAQLFLAEHPDLANLPCRFDVALVSCQRLSQRSHLEDIQLSDSEAEIGKATEVASVQLGQPVVRTGYQLILQDYIQSAFD
jgi:putative endonuclease